MNRYAYCHFCDDIRHEVGNKMSLMGIYNGELHVPILPISLPKLSIAVFCSTNSDFPFQSLIVKIEADGLLQETIIPKDDLDKIQAGIIENSTAQDPIQTITIGAPFHITPLHIEKESVVSVTFMADGEEILAGKLRIKYSPGQVPAEI